MTALSLQEWLTFIGTEIHKSFSPLFSAAMPEDFKHFFRDKLASRFKWLDARLPGRSNGVVAPAPGASPL